jgi:hypothetical protein
MTSASADGYDGGSLSESLNGKEVLESVGDVRRRVDSMRKAEKKSWRPSASFLLGELLSMYDREDWKLSLFWLC